MGGCASKPKTGIEKEVTPLPVEESKKEVVPKEAKVENGEKESDDQVDEKKVDVSEKKVEEDTQPLSLGCLLIQVLSYNLTF